MKADDVIRHFGNGDLPTAARVLGKPRQTLHWWRKNGIRPRTQRMLELASGGVLRADTRQSGD